MPDLFAYMLAIMRAQVEYEELVLKIATFVYLTITQQALSRESSNSAILLCQYMYWYTAVEVIIQGFDWTISCCHGVM